MKEGWKQVLFADIFDLQMGKTPSRDNPLYWGGENSWVSIADMKGAKYISETKERISDIAVSESGIKRVKKGTAIMSFKLSIGKASITKTDLYTNEAIMAFSVKTGYYVLPEYVYYYLKGYKWTGTNKAVMGETLNKKSISLNTFSYPPISEQEHIVAELNLLSSVIEKKKAQLKELDNLAQSIFYDMFGDPITNEKGWETRCIKEGVEQMFLGPFGSSLKTECYVEKTRSYCMVYEQKHAIKKTLDLDNHYIDKDKYFSLQRFEVNPGDIIMSCRGTIGEIYQLPDNAPKGIIHPSLMKIRLKQDFYNHIFFKTILRKIVANEDTNGGCVQMAITAKALGNKRIIYPSPDLQDSFAAKIGAIEQQKSAIKKSIDETQALFDSRMDYYFN